MVPAPCGGHGLYSLFCDRSSTWCRWCQLHVGVMDSIHYSAPDPPALGVDGTSTMWGSWALFIILWQIPQHLVQMVPAPCGVMGSIHWWIYIQNFTVHAPPMGPNSFIFTHIFTEKYLHQRTTHPQNRLQEILDLPLLFIMAYCTCRLR